jgi:hypothetical protein
VSFNDIMQGVQFFSGMTEGFKKTLDTERKNQEQTNLQLLALLNKDGTHSIEQLDPEDIDTSGGGLFGGGTVKTRDGLPAFKIGGNYFTARKMPTYTAADLLGGLKDDTAAPTDTLTQTPLTPPSSLFGPAPAPVQQQPTQPSSGRDWSSNYRKLKPQTQTQIDAYVAKYAKQYNIPIHDAYGIIAAESSFDPAARSVVKGKPGAIGLMQLMPGTAQELGVDPFNLEQNIEGGLRYYRQQLDTFKDPALARAAYNAGPEAVKNAGNKIPMNGETPTYVKRVGDAAQQFQGIFSGQKQAPAIAPTQPQDTSMQVAGDAAPAPQAAPTLPPLPAAPPAPKEQAFIRDYIVKNASPAGFTGTKGLTAFKDLRKEATAAYEKHVSDTLAEKRSVLATKKELIDEEHDPALRSMLENVQTAAQLDHYLQVRSTRPKMDPLTDATKYLQGLGEYIPDQEAAKVYNKLMSLGYKRDVAKDALDLAGYKDQKDLDKEAAKQRQKDKINAEGMPQRLKEKQAESDIQMQRHIEEAKIKKDYDTELKQEMHNAEPVPAEKLGRYVDAKTLMPIYDSYTWKELNDRHKDGTIIPMSPVNQDIVKKSAPVRVTGADVLELVNQVYGKGGPLESISQEKGYSGRLSGRYQKMINDAKAKYPVVRVLDERLKEWGVVAGRAAEGLGTRPGFWSMKEALSVRPTLGEPGEGIPGMLGMGGRLPDTRETIETQIKGVLSLMKETLQKQIGRVPQDVQSEYAPLPADKAPTKTPEELEADAYMEANKKRRGK